MSKRAEEDEKKNKDEIELFGDGSGSGSTGTKEGEAKTEYRYRESVDVPKRSDLKLYITRTSDITLQGNVVYDVNTNRWANMMYGNSFFSVIGIPPGIDAFRKSGLPLKNIVLRGPKSEDLGYQDPNEPVTYTIDTFTFAWLIDIRSLTIDSNVKPLILFKMFAETPSVLQVEIAPGNGNTDMFNLICTVGTQLYTWSVARTSLIGLGPTFITISYSKAADSGARSITLYLGNRVFRQNVSDHTKIKLGNSMVEMNSNGNIDAKLSCFMFFKKDLNNSEVKQLMDYITQTSSGYNRQLSEMQTKASVLQKMLQAVISTREEDSLSAEKCNELQVLLKKDLQKCLLENKSGKGRYRMPWTIEAEGSAAISGELQKCGLLDIKSALKLEAESVASLEQDGGNAWSVEGSSGRVQEAQGSSEVIKDVDVHQAPSGIKEEPGRGLLAWIRRIFTRHETFVNEASSALPEGAKKEPPVTVTQRPSLATVPVLGAKDAAGDSLPSAGKTETFSWQQELPLGNALSSLRALQKPTISTLPDDVAVKHIAKVNAVPAATAADVSSQQRQFFTSATWVKRG